MNKSQNLRGGRDVKANSQQNYQHEIKAVLNIDNFDPDGAKMIAVAEKYAQKVKKSMSVTQIRKIFSQVKALDAKDENYKFKLSMILVNFLYNSKRHDYDKEFSEFFRTLIEKTREKGEKELERFKNFFEAFVAYHKYYGGKD